jgi:hypothetical protein
MPIFCHKKTVKQTKPYHGQGRNMHKRLVTYINPEKRELPGQTGKTLDVILFYQVTHLRSHAVYHLANFTEISDWKKLASIDVQAITENIDHIKDIEGANVTWKEIRDHLIGKIHFESVGRICWITDETWGLFRKNDKRNQSQRKERRTRNRRGRKW